MDDLWVLLLTFLAGAVSVAGVSSLIGDVWLGDRRRVNSRVDAEFLQRQRERAHAMLLYKDLGRLAGELAADEPLVGWRQRLELVLEQAGLDVRVRVVGQAVAVGAAALAALGVVLTRSGWALPPGAALPLLYLAWRRGQRLDLMTTQLPDALEYMARALRAGQTMSQALQTVARDFPQPLAGEFAFCHERQNLGLAPHASYDDLARRVGLFELRIFALSMTVQQETGGNIAEMLDKLAAGLRDRLRGRLRNRLRNRALTAESRLQANALLALPVVVFVALWVLKRGHAEMLLAQPRLLGGTVAAQIVGAIWVHQIVHAGD